MAFSGSEFATTGLNSPESPLASRPASEAQTVEPESAALHDAALSAVALEIEGVQSTGDAAVSGDSDSSNVEPEDLEQELGLTADLLTTLALGALE